MLLITEHACLSTCNVVSQLVPPQRVQEEPIIKPEHPWEALGVYFQGSVLKDGDTFRMWYSVIGEQRREQQYLGYAESSDGVHWHKVLRREWGFGKWPETNVLYGKNFNISAPNVHFYHEPRAGYQYFCVFDSRIEQHENQYVNRKVPYSGPGDRARLMRHPNFTPDFDWKKYFNASTYRAVYLADSQDGLNWEPSDARFGIPGQSDGDHTVVWDPVRKYYRMYFRDNRLDENGERIRQVMTATSTDTVEWSEPQLCLESDAIDDPRVNQIHGMTVTYYDGIFIGLVQMLEIKEETPSWNPLLPFERGRFSVQLAVSYDGVRFHRVADRAEYFGTGTPGGFDGGMVRCGGQWVFDGDHMLMYYDGRSVEHSPKENEPYIVGIGVAQSPRDRFAGLTPRDSSRPGYLVVTLPENTSTLTLNCEVPDGATVTASLRHPDGSRVLSFSDEECVPITHGGFRAPLRWKTQENLPHLSGPLHLRLRLTGASSIYAMNS